jgi:RNA polymerase sigma factor (sigma-70 family)
MDNEQNDFQSLMNQVRNGSQDAVWELVSKYGTEVARAVRRKLSSRLRSKFGTSDFIQAMWVSFFRDRERFDAFEHPVHLIGFLKGIANNKVLQESRKRFDTVKSDVRRECPLPSMDISDDPAMWDNHASPSQWAIARERWDEIMRDQTPEHQKIIQMRVAGDTFEEIGTKLGINERTARRVIDRLVVEFEK